MAVFDSAKVDQPSLPNPWIKTSLYVGDLDEKVSPTDLFHVFSQTGKVSSVHLCVHALTGDSLRYGYVNFVSIVHVDQPSLPNPWIKTSLYVGDLDEKVSPTDLFHVFSRIGKVSSVHLCVHALTGDSLPYGYVNFVSTVDGGSLYSLNDTKLKGKPMRIMWCQRNPYPRRAGFTNLFAKNLDTTVTSDDMDSMFKVFGSCKVVEEDGKSKGFGFVHFEDEASVTAAMSAMHDKMLGGKKLYVARFMSRSLTDEKFTNLYVKNLDESLTDDNLREKISEFGTVCNDVIMRDGEGKPKGFGFINYASPEEAKKAVVALNGAEFGSKKLFVGRAQKLLIVSLIFSLMSGAEAGDEDSSVKLLKEAKTVWCLIWIGCLLLICTFMRGIYICCQLSSERVTRAALNHYLGKEDVEKKEEDKKKKEEDKKKKEEDKKKKEEEKEEEEEEEEDIREV